jgi:hypothetical protein
MILEQDFSSAETEDLEISIRLILKELHKRTDSRKPSLPYHYAAGLLNDNHHEVGMEMSHRLIKYAYEKSGVALACVVYQFFAPIRLNPETTIKPMAERYKWKTREI